MEGAVDSCEDSSQYFLDGMRKDVLVGVLRREDLLEMEVPHFSLGIFVLLVAHKQNILVHFDGFTRTDMVVLSVKVESCLGHFLSCWCFFFYQRDQASYCWMLSSYFWWRGAHSNYHFKALAALRLHNDYLLLIIKSSNTINMTDSYIWIIILSYNLKLNGK